MSKQKQRTFDMMTVHTVYISECRKLTTSQITEHWIHKENNISEVMQFK